MGGSSSRPERTGQESRGAWRHPLPPAERRHLYANKVAGDPGFPRSRFLPNKRFLKHDPAHSAPFPASQTHKADDRR
jgi:hypothetical protein